MNFIFDLDGTICFKGQPISPEIINALWQLHSADHNIIIASARPIRDIYPVIPEWMRQLNMIGGNGAFIQKEHIIQVTAFDCFSQLANIIELHQLAYLADSDWDYAYTGNVEHPIYQNIDTDRLAKAHDSYATLPSIVKLVLFTNDEQIIQQVEQLPVEIHLHNNETLIDISPKNINKYSGLQKLGISEYIAFGNDANDIPMFKHAKESICVGNHPEASQLAQQQINPDQITELILSYLN